MRPLIDGDVLRYEIGFAAETGWRAMKQDDEALPPFDYVRDMLEQRLDQICWAVGATESPCLFITEGRTFRYDLAKTLPYKGTRKDKKPWHFRNLTNHMVNVIGAQVVTYLEADDAITIEHVNSPDETVIVTRDKDLRQVPGWLYQWELGNQPEFGPALITKEGHLRLSSDRKRISGTGLPYFYSQCLTGDRVDNIPGVKDYGPVRTFEALGACSTLQHYLDTVIEVYQVECGDEWEEYLTEQGRLLWMTRHLTQDYTPVMWEIGMEE